MDRTASPAGVQAGFSGRGGQPAPWRHAVRARRASCARCAATSQGEVTLLDYGAGNVRSVRNAIRRLGFDIKEVQSPRDILDAKRLIFPGVGAFEQMMGVMKEREYLQPLREYIEAGRPFLGICLGLQLLFEGSEENGGVEGLGLVPGRVRRFDASAGLPVPHIGWNDLDVRHSSQLFRELNDRRVYFVHSFCAAPEPQNSSWVLATTHYGGEFVSAVQRGEVYATQFHPEKSGDAGAGVLRSFLTAGATGPGDPPPAASNGAHRFWGAAVAPRAGGRLLERLGRSLQCLGS